MRRLSTTNRKRVFAVCVLCSNAEYRGKDLGKKPTIEFIHIPPLENKFHPVCTECIPVLEKYKNMFPYLWE
jgi:hypothetical protein